jgi:hypothetical protein
MKHANPKKKKSASAEIWKSLTPRQRLELLGAAETSVHEVVDPYDTETDEVIAEVKARVGIDDPHLGFYTWSRTTRGALVKKGLLKIAPIQGAIDLANVVLTPLGRRAVEHAKSIMRRAVSAAEAIAEKKKSARQLDTEIAEVLTKGDR